MKCLKEKILIFPFHQRKYKNVNYKKYQKAKNNNQFVCRCTSEDLISENRVINVVCHNSSKQKTLFLSSISFTFLKILLRSVFRTLSNI